MRRIVVLVFTWAVLLSAGLALAGCSSSDDEPVPVTPQPSPGVYTLKVRAGLGQAVTRGTFTVDDKTYVLKWSASDRVDVKKDGELVGTLQPETEGDASADLWGTLTGTFAAGNQLTLTYPKAAVSYTGQKGTLADIAANYAYATATVSVTDVSGTTVTAGDATFAPQQAIVKFTLKDELNAAINASAITIAGCGQEVTVAGASSATGEYYVAVPAVSSAHLTLTATAGSSIYKYIRPNVTLAAGRHYEYSVRMGKQEAFTPSSTPLTLQAINAPGKITFAKAIDGTVQYSKNGGVWTDYSSPIDVAVGDKVSFRGSNSTYYNSTGSGSSSRISCTAACYVYGNVMSLISSDEYSSAESLSGELAFSRLFQENVMLRSHPYKDLVLPATTLTTSCYQNMFNGCTGLTRSAILADAKGAKNAYQYMYNGCTSLVEVTCYAAYNGDYFTGWLTSVASNGTFYTNSTHKTSWDNFHSMNIEDWTIAVKE